MNHRQHLDSQIMSWDLVRNKTRLWRFADKKIVFSNGVFDLLHAGHVDYLAKAASFGDKLIVGINSDDSVSRLKGPLRPVNPENARCLLIAALEFVDAVTIFTEDTPYELIKAIMRDVLVKGADYKEDEIVGYDIVKQNGGEVKTIELLDGFSSTLMMEKIRKV
ncbi:MAG: D-glycero-beta-D-manno-heptose 1-phosphate adenylyltransferase [Bacteroidia bacterium]|nr:D-glycero-beta-D-manno-heptose 1-phosphate adenylyltransferase [Bacteroidia bacterium]